MKAVVAALACVLCLLAMVATGLLWQRSTATADVFVGGRLGAVYTLVSAHGRLVLTWRTHASVDVDWSHHVYPPRNGGAQAVLYFLDARSGHDASSWGLTGFRFALSDQDPTTGVRRGLLAVPYWAILVASPIWPLIWFRGRLRRRRRVRVGRCAGCGYDLRFNRSGRCPECGRPTAHLRRSSPEPPQATL